MSYKKCMDCRQISYMLEEEMKLWHSILVVLERSNSVTPVLNEMFKTLAERDHIPEDIHYLIKAWEEQKTIREEYEIFCKKSFTKIIEQRHRLVEEVIGKPTFSQV